MFRTILHVCCAALFALAAVPAQSAAEIAKFATDSKKLIELNDEKGLDKLIKSSPTMASAVVSHFMNLRLEQKGGKQALAATTTAINTSWKRCYDGADTLDKLERWVEGLDNTSWSQFTKAQSNVRKAYAFYVETTGKDNTVREPFVKAREVLTEAAKIMESTGNKAEASDAWYYVALCLEKIPEKSIQDREERVLALEQFVSLRDSWNYKDLYYVQIKNLLKAQKDELEVKKKETEKRKDEGYSEGAKGIDAMVMAGVAEKETPLQFSMLAAWEEEPDYSQRGGIAPPFWWYVAFGTDAKETKLAWFRRLDLTIVRTAPAKFSITTSPSDPSRYETIEPSAKAKPVTFHLDPDKKVPYAMFFWQGSDRERLGECEVNLAPAPQNTPIYYRSASSWTAEVQGEQVTFQAGMERAEANRSGSTRHLWARGLQVGMFRGLGRQRSRSACRGILGGLGPDRRGEGCSLAVRNHLWRRQRGIRRRGGQGQGAEDGRPVRHRFCAGARWLEGEDRRLAHQAARKLRLRHRRAARHVPCT